MQASRSKPAATAGERIKSLFFTLFKIGFFPAIIIINIKIFRIIYGYLRCGKIIEGFSFGCALIPNGIPLYIFLIIYFFFDFIIIILIYL